MSSRSSSCRGLRANGPSTLAFSLAIAAATSACGESTPLAPVPSSCGVSPSALVVASDYASSAIGRVSLDGTSALQFGDDLGRDPAFTVSRGRAFVLARDRELAFELDRCGAPIARIPLGASGPTASNPQDLAVAPNGELWVPRFNQPNLAILPAVTGGGGAAEPLATIDLASEDPDGNPNASSVRIVDVGGVAKAFVTLQRLDDRDGLRSKQPSTMLRIDVASRTVEGRVTLEGRNPFGPAWESGGVLWLAEAGSFDDAAEAGAGIERFDPATSTSRLLVREPDLGGSVVQLAVDGRCGAAIVASAVRDVNNTSLVAFDAETGQVVSKNVIGPTEGFDLQGLTFVREGDRTVLLVGDRRRTAKAYAVHILDRAETCTLTARPTDLFVDRQPVALRTLP